MVHIRTATPKDIPAITKIYNDAIQTTVATFDTEEKTIDEQKQWFKSHGPRNPILVAEKQHCIVGWAALSQWSDRCAYDQTAELSIYVDLPHQRKGIGTQLLNHIIRNGKEAGLHAIIARITEANTDSIRLHESVGFVPIGTMKEVGYKFGTRLDVYLMQKIYTD